MKKFNVKTLESLLDVSTEEANKIINEGIELFNYIVENNHELSTTSMIIGKDDEGVFFNLNFLILILTNYGESYEL